MISDPATTSSANQDHIRATRFEQQAYPDMRSLTTVLALLSLLSTYTSATALTYKLVPNEKECFYTHVSNAGAKIAFYFAVSSGGNFDGAPF